MKKIPERVTGIGVVVVGVVFGVGVRDTGGLEVVEGAQVVSGDKRGY